MACRRSASRDPVEVTRKALTFWQLPQARCRRIRLRKGLASYACESSDRSGSLSKALHLSSFSLAGVSFGFRMSGSMRKRFVCNR